ncbi:uncharacterized protein LOC124450690 [Xenia sp. Carnegie-2017]|uniref:uncharacterized protein LOC124450690 n=1 Tax=Xenia sp. Carnegie-2017 TaxID=2897299 RepID=UPI001F0409C0|nr:uncharacterized protein LOC124450690 [Xenia sp. Carnegie-2017]
MIMHSSWTLFLLITLSHLNVVVLQSSLYSCSFTCLNGGYCGPTDAGTITCICPRGYTGSDCSEIVPCYNNSDCKNSKMCKLYYGNRYCDCENEFTGFDCSTNISRDVTPLYNNVLSHYWSFNTIPFGQIFVDNISRSHFTRYGDARLFQSSQLGNVAKLNKYGHGALISDSLKDPCLARSHKCDDGSSISFWLQFISGSVVLRSVNVGFNVYVKNGKFFVNFQSADNRRWEIERSCIPMGFFFVTATWRSTEGLFYYENGILVDVANFSVANSLTVNSNDVISVGFEDVSNVKRYSSLFIDDIMIWRRALNQNEVYTVYTNGLNTVYSRSPCLSNVTCASGQWCVQNTTGHSCISPSNGECSFSSNQCVFGNLDDGITAANSDAAIQENMPYHDHTVGRCTVPPSKFFIFRQNSTQTTSMVKSYTFNSSSEKGLLFRLRFWYFMYGQDKGKMSVLLSQNNSTSTIWSTALNDNRNWQYQLLEMKSSAQNITFTMVANFSGPNLVVALDDLNVKVCNPYTRPNVMSVVIVTNGTINITWTQTGCSNDFSYSTMVYLLSPVSGNWSLVTTTAASFHVIDSMIFLPNSTYQFKVNTRYVLNNEVIISDDSNIYNFTFPATFVSSWFYFEDPTFRPTFSTTLGYLIERGKSFRIGCNASSPNRPTITLSISRTFPRLLRVLHQTSTPLFDDVSRTWYIIYSIPNFGEGFLHLYLPNVISRLYYPH